MSLDGEMVLLAGKVWIAHQPQELRKLHGLVPSIHLTSQQPPAIMPLT